MGDGKLRPEIVDNIVSDRNYKSDTPSIWPSIHQRLQDIVGAFFLKQLRSRLLCTRLAVQNRTC
jgi:hypothetical protein